MPEDNQYIDFSTVLASAVHDMKNSLCLLMQSLDNLTNVIPQDNIEGHNQLAAVHYEASRMNTGLVQMLSMYRSEKNQLPLNISECYIEDLFDELEAANQSYIQHKNITLNIKLDQNLVWYLDTDIIYLLINDMLINAMRYGDQRIALSAFEEEDYLVIQIEDDGPGYPPSMLQINETKLTHFNVKQGRTGLGIYFARLIAEAHSTSQGVGSIRLTNGGTLGGSVFQLKLP